MDFLKTHLRLILIATCLLGLVGLGGFYLGRSGQQQHSDPTASGTAHAAHKDSHLKNADGTWKYTNQLIKESSPYLLLHAHNPVDWNPWNQAALDRAKAENKPIFLSVGYSTCYWCHVMERKVFSDPDIAALMNQWFVNIKVDREERPDLDEIYMTATQLITGHGGWPNSVFLTPDLRPFFAGTYFPPEDMQGRPGFPRVLQAIHTAWQERRSDLETQADQLAKMIQKIQGNPSEKATDLSWELIQAALDHLTSRYDSENGGFSKAPKFPPDHALMLLLAEYRRTGDLELLQRVTHTLNKMAEGGIRDHLGGGFHRYATDARWLVPHFEKMLYNQAQLADVYLEAFEITKTQRYREVVEEIFQYVAREMTHPQGPFYSALDAETHAEEGAYYVWTEGDIRHHLGADADLFFSAYTLAPMPEGEGQVLHLAPDPPSISVQDRLPEWKEKLLHTREQREKPFLDDKIIVAWNGLMIGALAKGAQILDNPNYLNAAQLAADFLLKYLVDQQGNLKRIYRLGQARQEGYQEDYAFLTHGLLRLYQASHNPYYLEQSQKLTARMQALFSDPGQGGFFFSTPNQDLIARSKSPHDSAIPSGNAVAIHALLTLFETTGSADYLQQARETLRAFSTPAQNTPGAFLHLIHGAQRYLEHHSIHAQQLAEQPRHPVVETKLTISSVSQTALEATLHLTIQKGWHINANPASEELLIPTSLTLTDSTGVALSSIQYPAPQHLQFDYADTPLGVYVGAVAIPFTLASSTRSLPDTLVLELTYQPCDDARCLPPITTSIPVDLSGRRP
ncbi:MAG: DUF255 domain-containing protein [bacterium]|nr:DUF255 domain-containing protein [bacterium]